MGIAAYNRGSRNITRQIDAARPSAAALLYDELSAISASVATITGFCPTVVRQGPGPGEWSIMSRKDRGWGEYSYTFNSLRALFRVWRLVVTGDGRDQHSWYIEVAPLPKKAAA